MSCAEGLCIICSVRGVLCEINMSPAGTSLSRVAHAAAHNTPRVRCVSAGGATVPLADIFIPHSRDWKGEEGDAKAGKREF